MPEPDIATLTHRLAALTRRAVGERMAHETWAHQAGFRPGCIGVLRVVAAREPVSQREVSEALLLDPSDLVTLVDILERAGLVERRRDPADRRRYALEVTPRGKLAVVRLREINREANEELLAPLDEHEREQLAELIGRVVRHHTGQPEPGRPDDHPEPHARTRTDADLAGARTDAAAAGSRTDDAAQPDDRAQVVAGRSWVEDDSVREVPVMPGHPERAREPYDPNREAARARAAEWLGR
jgi:DNA-binding MarR family transcriptional regulator